MPDSWHRVDTQRMKAPFLLYLNAGLVLSLIRLRSHELNKREDD